MALVKTNVRALHDEIERLSAACEEHERKIRASRVSFWQVISGM
jgi:hypothetical protein